MKVPHTLDSEFKRVAKAEGVAMEELVAEVAKLIKKSERHVYNMRSGKWPIPNILFPVFCKRFRSLALANALVEDCRETPIDVPEEYELAKLVSQTVRDDLKHYEGFLDAFEDGVIEKAELDRLLVSGDRVVHNIHQFEAIAVADYQRRQRFQKAQSNETPTKLPTKLR